MKFRREAKQLEAGGKVHQLFFYDDIAAKGQFNWETWQYDESETSAKYIRDWLQEIPAGETIEVHINSRGGEVGEGTAIYNLLRQKAQDGTSIIGYIDGYAYSIAMTIAMACSEIHMGLGTTMFLHRPWATGAGNADDFRNLANELDALAEASLKLYSHRAKNATEEQIREMMVKETTLTPEDCLRYGFCDVLDTYEAESLETVDQKKPAGPAVAQLAEIKLMLQSLSEPAPAPPQEPEYVSTIKDTLTRAMKGE